MLNSQVTLTYNFIQITIIELGNGVEEALSTLNSRSLIIFWQKKTIPKHEIIIKCFRSSDEL